MLREPEIELIPFTALCKVLVSLVGLSVIHFCYRDFSTKELSPFRVKKN